MVESNMSDDLWMCPECGHRFVTRNMWHSCARHPVEAHCETSDTAPEKAVAREEFGLRTTRQCPPRAAPDA